jgi:tRNA modification GTPase
MDYLNEIESVNKGLNEGLSDDLLSIDLNEGIINISIITGKIDINQDILGSIFSKFFIGEMVNYLIYKYLNIF